ncbi:hypothetical protein Nepgr_028995 [Nepenthes gracilis]|uniref:Uncharacterized protein n=1 Tax=Nepenthes gracilis TaxID=150966 RepID=A0AAD3TEM3_NEPGR|nr:hypothetical protein Nepgr_028995 [Nepenthes gracilis]
MSIKESPYYKLPFLNDDNIQELFDKLDPDSQSASARPFDDAGNLGLDHRLDSQRFGSFPSFVESESIKELNDDSLTFNNNSRSNWTFVSGNDDFSSGHAPESPIGDGLRSYTPEDNGNSANGVFIASDGPVLLPLSEMQEEGFALGEWRRHLSIFSEI